MRADGLLFALLVSWLVVLIVCLPVSSLLLPHNRLRFLTRPVLSQSSEGISPSFSYSYCCLSSAVSLLVSCGFVVARRISFCGFSSWLVVCRFLNPPFFFLLLSLFGTTHTHPAPPLLYFQGPRVVYRYRGRERKRAKETQSRGRRIHLNLQSVNSVYGFHSDVSAELLAAPSLIRSRFVSG